jgi:hypothetical protein
LTAKNPSFKVVYFSFSFEAIDNQAQKNEVMGKVLDWLSAMRQADAEVIR